LNGKENQCWATTTDAKQNLSKRESTDPTDAHEIGQNLSKRESTDPTDAHEIGGRSQPRRTEAEAEKKTGGQVPLVETQTQPLGTLPKAATVHPAEIDRRLAHRSRTEI
jgi:hypothetical protein